MVCGGINTNFDMIDKNLIDKYNLILASASPRRRELIQGLDIKINIAEKYDVDETVGDFEDVLKVAEIVALKKSTAYPFELKSNDILITSDTVVCVEDMVLGKPKDREDAIRMLAMLSGKEHFVVTAVTLRIGDKFRTFSQNTEVKFKELSREDIEYYIDNYKPYDKAGAYAIQEWIGYVAIEHIKGSFYNVMGLPVCRLYTELNELLINQNK